MLGEVVCDEVDVVIVQLSLRQPEACTEALVVDYMQGFVEGLWLAKDKMNEKNVYFINPSFDK